MITNKSIFRVTDTPEGNIIVTFFWAGVTKEEISNTIFEKIFNEVQKPDKKIFDGLIVNNYWNPQIIEKLRRRVNRPVNAVKIEKE